jgi:hypothetical protein
MRHLNFVRFLLNVGREVCMNILDDIPKQTSNNISDHDFLKMYIPFDDISNPFWKSIFEPTCCRMQQLVDEEIPNVISAIEFAIYVISGNTNYKDFGYCDEGKLERKKFEDLKKAVQNNSNFDNALKLRLKSYILRMTEIKYSVEELIKKTESLEVETKNALWTPFQFQ